MQPSSLLLEVPLSLPDLLPPLLMELRPDSLLVPLPLVPGLLLLMSLLDLLPAPRQLPNPRFRQDFQLAEAVQYQHRRKSQKQDCHDLRERQEQLPVLVPGLLPVLVLVPSVPLLDLLLLSNLLQSALHCTAAAALRTLHPPLLLVQLLSLLLAQLLSLLLVQLLSLLLVQLLSLLPVQLC